jgi:hypothetical protein
MNLQILEVNGGCVSSGPLWHLDIPKIEKGYTNAQMDDYHGLRRKRYLWKPGSHLSLRARFSHSASELRGTAGFGFWNAPFGDPSVPWPTLPRAVWFFFASDPNNLPLASTGSGQGWFASTIGVDALQTATVLPLAPAILLLNQFKSFRNRLWPRLRQHFNISYQPIRISMEGWHKYDLSWKSNSCEFRIDDKLLHKTTYSPKGPLGFVCWIDNQYLIVTLRGKFRWGTLKLAQPQWMEIDNLAVGPILNGSNGGRLTQAVD